MSCAATLPCAQNWAHDKLAVSVVSSCWSNGAAPTMLCIHKPAKYRNHQAKQHICTLTHGYWHLVAAPCRVQLAKLGPATCAQSCSAPTRRTRDTPTPRCDRTPPPHHRAATTVFPPRLCAPLQPSSPALCPRHSRFQNCRRRSFTTDNRRPAALSQYLY